MNKKINFASAHLPNSLIKTVGEVIKSKWLAHGKYTNNFESLFTKFTDIKYATTVSSCTAGLHLCCMALNIKKGDEVIVPAMTHVSTAHIVEYTGAKPVFVDIDKITGNMNPKLIENKISKKTKAIIPVHMAGKLCDMKEIKRIAKKHNLEIIEDCAHALGTKNNTDSHAGSFGVAGCFSFYPTKQITTGEGGMVVSNNKKFIKKIKMLKAFGIDNPPQNRKSAGLYNVQALGFNYRMTDFQAAMGFEQMKIYRTLLNKRHYNAELYTKLLKKNNNLININYSNLDSFFIYQIITKNDSTKNRIVNILIKSNIGYSIHYATPVPLLNFYKKKYNYKAKQFKKALFYSKNVISLPCHPDLSKKDILFICNKINSV